MRDATKTIRLAADGLKEVLLPSLSRPINQSDFPDTSEGACWAVRAYCYSVILHVQEILEAMAQQVDGKNWGALLILGRHLYEWAAHVCYVREKAKLHINNAEWRAMWDVMAHVMTANQWMQTYGKHLAAQKGLSPPTLPKPIRVSQFIKCYEAHLRSEVGVKDPEGDYGLLSEYSHASGASLYRYQSWSGGSETDTVTFEIRDYNEILPLLGRTALSVVTLLLDGLKIAQDTAVAQQMSDVLQNIIENSKV